MRLNFRLLLSPALLLILTVATVAQGTRYEAENGTLTGAVTVQSSLAGYSGTGYAGIFQNEGDAVSVAITLTQGGWYKLYLGYAAPYGDKKNIVGINGNSSEASFPATASFTEITFGKV